MLADEPAGADGKAWLTPPGAERSESRADWWLFKPAKTGLVKATGGQHATEYRRNDDRVERIASQLARCLGLPAAEVRLARRDALEGCLSRYAIPDGWSMASGDLVLAEFDGYVSCANDPKVKERSGHNLSNIQVLMDGLFGPPFGAFSDVPAFDVFAGYLVFDAWIANTDRHAVNWAMLYRGNDVCLAPSFDHGSALGSGLRDTGIPADVDAWCARGMAGRFEGGRSRTLVDLALDAVQRGGPKAGEWLRKLAAITPEQSREILRGVPGLSVATSTFMGTVLETNQRRLCA
ncbi:HipA domain-containing protein [Phycicoccus sp. Soil803]|uniref:HipA domain-containing protein n=1 Tax=Phycicoccus sp. Soil803 TaxID=1736415 RepID=UPI001F30CC86|nr:HipA domain-containing protein [Phycicoccus sp. Soil803]